MFIIRMLIIFCAKRALKYDQMKQLLLNEEGVDYIYAVGTMVYNKERWLNRIHKLQEIVYNR